MSAGSLAKCSTAAWRGLAHRARARLAGRARTGGRCAPAPRHGAAPPITAPMDSQARSQTVRVSVDTLEHLMTTVSELVLTRNQLLELVRRSGESEFKAPLQRLSTVTAELQEGIMKARMQPIANAWQKLPRLVRELSLDLGKKIELEMTGGDTELDRQVLELIKDPLTHMIRNSADHGHRASRGAPQAGKPDDRPGQAQRLSAGRLHRHRGGDDGRGLDAAKDPPQGAGARARHPGRARSPERCRHLQFHLPPGLLHGERGHRGLGPRRRHGRGAQQYRAHRRHRRAEIHLGQRHGLRHQDSAHARHHVGADRRGCGQRFAIPQFSVVELVRAGEISEHRVELINDAAVLRLRDRLLPLLDLAQLLELEGAHVHGERQLGDTLTVVVMQIGARSFGVLVDSVFHTEEIVVKPMASLLRDVTMFSGNTILGDGSVIMIIDPNALGSVVGAVAMSRTNAAPAEKAMRPTSGTEATALAPVPRGLAHVEGGAAVADHAARGDQDAEIEHCNGSGRGAISRRADAARLYRRDEPRARGDVQPVLVFTEGRRPVGLAIDAIVDIVEERLTIEIAAEEPGLIGAAIVRGKAVEIVDVSHYLGKGARHRLKAKDDPRGAR